VWQVFAEVDTSFLHSLHLVSAINNSLLIKQLDDNQLNRMLTRNKWPLINTAMDSGNGDCATFLRHLVIVITFKLPIHAGFNVLRKLYYIAIAKTLIFCAQATLVYNECSLIRCR
jgi:hypothetical protein